MYLLLQFIFLFLGVLGLQCCEAFLYLQQVGAIL